jgi:hypothetical protein
VNERLLEALLSLSGISRIKERIAGTNLPRFLKVLSTVASSEEIRFLKNLEIRSFEWGMPMYSFNP